MNSTGVPDPALSAVGHNERANQLQQLRLYDEAVAGYQTAIALDPGLADAHANLGAALRALGQPGQAVAACDRAIALRPDFAAAHHNRANALRDLGRAEEALAAYDRAISLDPGYDEAVANKALALLSAGDFAGGWPLYEARRARLGLDRDRPYVQPRLTDGPLKPGESVYLYWEQGLGDTLQFCRYAPLIRATGAPVVMAVQDPLVRLLRHSLPMVQIAGARQAPAAFDRHSPLMSLPLAFGATLERIPATPRYLGAEPALLAQWSKRLGPKTKPRIGLVWSGAAGHANDRNRSLRLEQLAPLLAHDADWIALQKEIRPEDAETLKRWGNIRRFDAELTDFADTAALIEALDLVIAVDTSVAHLAGALGRPVWILLPTPADWRWLGERSDSPWYPSARLFRQSRLGDWAPVIAAVAAALP